MPTCGSLFSGVGLLDIGLHLAGFEHRWMCESDPWRRELLRARFGVPVHDDIRTLRGPAAVDVIAGGFPCKGASSAGTATGLEHAETALWGEMRRVVRDLRPRYVLIENVANILGMAAAPGELAGSLWGTVLGDLAALRYDVRWDCIPAAAVGAPHLRDRVFAVATDTDTAGRGERGGRVAGAAQHAAAERDGANAAHAEREPVELRGGAGAVGGPPGGRGGAPRQQRAGSPAAHRDQDAVAVDWGVYRAAIERWEAVHGAAPEPLVRRLDDGDAALRRVRARVDRSRLSALGDGVHVYVGWLAGEYVMGLERERMGLAA